LAFIMLQQDKSKNSRQHKSAMTVLAFLREG
jgi:hypothetical protein